MSYEITNAQLHEHFKGALADAEALVSATADLGGEKLAGLRSRAEESLRLLRLQTAEAQDAFGVKSRAAANATDAYVHANPWEAIGIAASVGLFLGVLLARR